MSTSVMRALVDRLVRPGVALGLCVSIAVGHAGVVRAEERALEDVLRALQARGLRIIFSSRVVTREMRVTADPRATDLRRQLDEVLAPHGLIAAPGPGGVILILRDRRAKGTAAAQSASPARSEPGAEAPSEAVDATYTERVMVTASRDEAWVTDGGSGFMLDRRDLESFNRGLVDDPLRALQAAPHAGVGDDFSSEVSVRASPARHTGVVVDGVATPWLRHSAPGRGDAGSVTMIGSEVVEQATLQAGSYPRRHGDQLGGQVELGLRDGSRVAPVFRATLSRTLAGGTAEGPLGHDARGSVLLAIRRSHVEWPINRTDHGSTVFGFTDAMTRLVYDVRPTQQITVSLLAGQSTLERDDANPTALGGGTNRTALLSVGWRSLVGGGLVIQQRLAAVAHDFTNLTQARAPAGAGENTDVLYRADAVRATWGGVLETGVQVEHRRGFRQGLADGAVGHGAPPIIDWGRGANLAAWTSAAYAHYRWSTPRFTLAPGLRLTASTMTDRPAVDRWLQGEWRWGAAWHLHGSAALVHQLPQLDHVRGWATTRRPLEPEQAVHADVGIRHRIRGSVAWSITAFTRNERNLLRRHEPAAVADPIDDSIAVAHTGFENALTGLARGVEVAVERRAGPGLTGWLGYAFGVARLTDPARHETFRADFDQRHSLNAVASYRLQRGWAFGATFKAGSDVPIPGALRMTSDGTLVAGSTPNVVRLPPYARLDLRAEYALVRGNRALTLYAEVVNVLDRRNIGLAAGYISPAGEAVGFTQPQYPRLWSGGARVTF